MRLKQEEANHARLIESAVRGGLTDIDPAVRSSWTRCLSNYSLDPLQIKKPLIVERSDLQERRERIGSLLPIARIEMLNLSRLMPQSQFGIMLTDQDGVILCYVGAPGFSHMARRSGFREGAVWSESEQGTNGMGTCLISKRPLVIHKVDHFLVQNTELTCSAAPIFDAQGRMLAALDISGCGGKAPMHTLALVDIAAQNIENRALLDACRGHYVLRFHHRHEFVCTPGEGVLAVDQQGTVVGANRGALELLGYREHSELCSMSIDSVFDTSLAFLMQLGSRPGLRAEAISPRRGHLKMFVQVQAPASEIRRLVRGGYETATAEGALDRTPSRDPAILANNQIAVRVMNRDISILLLGETGTGKGYFAKAIHSASKRAEKPFVAVNCAAIPELLIESELFGYKPGAFTGAARNGHPGRILQANGGTLFLDEIGDMPLSLQARLLGVIEDREVLPLGGCKPVPVDIRIISATHRNLGEMVARGQFRDDLFYRLNGIMLTLPPLRQRKDMREMVHHLLRLEAGEREVRIDDALVERLVRDPWPGNLRQLRNVLRNLLALSETDELSLGDLDEHSLRSGGMTGAPPSTGNAAAPAEIPEPAEGADDVLGSAECEALQRTLEACSWNVSEAAAKLHVSRKTMYRKMHRHGLVRQSAEPRATPPGRVRTAGQGSDSSTGSARFLSS